jgi:hypothetical protein
LSGSAAWIRAASANACRRKSSFTAARRSGRSAFASAAWRSSRVLAVRRARRGRRQTTAKRERGHGRGPAHARHATPWPRGRECRPRSGVADRAQRQTSSGESQEGEGHDPSSTGPAASGAAVGDAEAQRLAETSEQQNPLDCPTRSSLDPGPIQRSASNRGSRERGRMERRAPEGAGHESQRGQDPQGGGLWRFERSPKGATRRRSRRPHAGHRLRHRPDADERPHHHHQREL